MNNVNINGYLTDTPELKTLNTPNNTPCLEFAIGHTRSFTNEKGNLEKETSFFEVVFYGKYAEHVVNRLHKGTLVFIEGSLQQHKWKHEDKTYTKVTILGKRMNIIEKDRRNVPAQANAASTNEENQTATKPDTGADSGATPTDENIDILPI